MYLILVLNYSVQLPLKTVTCERSLYDIKMSFIFQLIAAVKLGTHTVPYKSAVLHCSLLDYDSYNTDTKTVVDAFRRESTSDEEFAWIDGMKILSKETCSDDNRNICKNFL